MLMMDIMGKQPLTSTAPNFLVFTARLALVSTLKPKLPGEPVFPSLESAELDGARVRNDLRPTKGKRHRDGRNASGVL